MNDTNKMIWILIIGATLLVWSILILISSYKKTKVNNRKRGERLFKDFKIRKINSKKK